MRAWAVVETGKPLKEIELPTPEPTGKQMDGSINDFMLYRLREWFDRHFTPSTEATNA